MVLIKVPKVGALSRKECDDLKAFGQERGLRVFDDIKSLERKYPEQAARVRAGADAAEDDLLLIADWRASRKGTVPNRPSIRRAASYVCMWRRSTRSAMACSIRAPSHSSG
jgi:aspartyl-tRNA synthetase